MGDIKRRYIRKNIIAICLVIALLFTNIDVKSAYRSDYLDITLADIILTWYNASGVAIGSSELANEIQSAYGNITIDDLIEADVFKTTSVVSDPGSQSDKDLIRDLIGYGNLTAPSIQVRPTKLKEFLLGYPVAENAEKALKAMFGYETDGGLVSDTFSVLLGGVIGTVANIGKIGYNFVTDVVSEGRNIIEDFWPYKTLKSVYDKFTNTDYFQDLLIGSEEEPSLEYVYNGDLEGFDGWGYISYHGREDQGWLFLMNRDVVPFLVRNSSRGYCYIYNLNGNEEECKVYNGYIQDGEIIKKGLKREYVITNNSYVKTPDSFDIASNAAAYAVNKALVFVSSSMNSSQQLDYVQTYNPWNSSVVENPESPSVKPGVTNYINRTVGNILSDNYLNLSPNISRDDYMYIFTRDTYNNILNEITNNNGSNEYTENSTIINNYNNTYIQEGVPIARPTSAPAESEQPIQPFISPRPSPIPEEVESVIYEGGISEEITKKFPFCIPWDIKAMIDNLWAPEARAPYIHWNATFGNYGKLGEVEIDLAPYDGVAAIFRSTTLLLWIVGLLVLTKNLLG